MSKLIINGMKVRHTSSAVAPRSVIKHSNANTRIRESPAFDVPSLFLFVKLPTKVTENMKAASNRSATIAEAGTFLEVSRNDLGIIDVHILVVCRE